VLRRIFGPKRVEVRGEWRRKYKKELYALYSLTNIIRLIKSTRLEIGSSCNRYEKKRGKDRILVGKSEGSRPLSRSKSRWEDNIKMDLREMLRGDILWLDLDRGRWLAVMSAVINVRVP
jgi:hypothetical protein